MSARSSRPRPRHVAVASVALVALASAAGSALLPSCLLDTSGLTGGGTAADAGDASVAPTSDGGREGGCAGVDAAVCEDFDRPSALDAWSPAYLTNGGQLGVDSTASVSAPNALWARTPASGPVPRNASISRTVTLRANGLAVDLDVLVETGCPAALAMVSDDLLAPYYQIELVAELGQPFRLVENHNDNTTRHDGSQVVTSAWSHVRCAVGFAPALVDCFVDGQHVVDRVAITPTRSLSGRDVHVIVGINFDSTTTGCSARIDNYVLTTW